MDVGVVGHLPSPGVKHPKEAREIAADVFSVLRQFLYGSGGGLEKGRIADALMVSDKAPKLLGNGEGDHEVMSRELSLHLIAQPLMGLVVLAVGTMPVAAGLIDDVAFTAFFTLVDHGSAIFGAAVDHGVHDLAML